MDKTLRTLSAVRLIGLAAALGGLAGASLGAAVSATSSPISVDARGLSHRRMVSPETLAYSPYWLDAVNGSSRAVRIDVVADPDTASATTSTLFTAGNGVESAYGWTPDYEAQPFCRLLHWTLDGGAPTGTPLVCDVVFGVRSAASAALSADTRTNSLQEVADANGTAGLTYSPLWGGGASVKIERIRQRTDVAWTTTNTLFESEAGLEAAYAFDTRALASGHYVLRHIALNASAQPVGDILTAEFDIRRPKGSLLCVF